MTMSIRDALGRAAYVFAHEPGKGNAQAAETLRHLHDTIDRYGPPGLEPPRLSPVALEAARHLDNVLAANGPGPISFIGPDQAAVRTVLRALRDAYPQGGDNPGDGPAGETWTPDARPGIDTCPSCEHWWIEHPEDPQRTCVGGPFSQSVGAPCQCTAAPPWAGWFIARGTVDLEQPDGSRVRHSTHSCLSCHALVLGIERPEHVHHHDQVTAQDRAGVEHVDTLADTVSEIGAAVERLDAADQTPAPPIEQAPSVPVRVLRDLLAVWDDAARRMDGGYVDGLNRARGNLLATVRAWQGHDAPDDEPAPSTIAVALDAAQLDVLDVALAALHLEVPSEAESDAGVRLEGALRVARTALGLPDTSDGRNATNRYNAMPDGLQDALDNLAGLFTGSTSGQFAAHLIDRYPGAAHAIDRVTRFADPPVDVYAQRWAKGGITVVEPADVTPPTPPITGVMPDEPTIRVVPGTAGPAPADGLLVIDARTGRPVDIVDRDGGAWVWRWDDQCQRYGYSSDGRHAQHTDEYMSVIDRVPGTGDVAVRPTPAPDRGAWPPAPLVVRIAACMSLDSTDSSSTGEAP